MNTPRWVARSRRLRQYVLLVLLLALLGAGVLLAYMNGLMAVVRALVDWHDHYTRRPS